MIDQPAVKFWPWTSTVTSGHDATAPRLSRATSAEAAVHAGTAQSLP